MHEDKVISIAIQHPDGVIVYEIPRVEADAEPDDPAILVRTAMQEMWEHNTTYTNDIIYLLDQHFKPVLTYEGPRLYMLRCRYGLQSILKYCRMRIRWERDHVMSFKEQEGDHGTDVS